MCMCGHVGAMERWLRVNLALSTEERGSGGMEIKGKGLMHTFCLCKLEPNGARAT